MKNLPPLTVVKWTMAMVFVGILMNANHCRATISPMTINTVADANLELEFLMESHISRMLTGSIPVTDAIKNRKPIYGCGPGNRYCLPNQNRPPRCSKYDRGNCR